MRQQVKYKNMKLIPFDKYMEICLYDEKIGYYIKNKKIFGKEGDFYTPQTVSSLFGKLIGEFLKKEKFKNVYEFGGGEGFLAFDILSFNKEIENYFFIEISEKLKERAFEKNKEFKNKIHFLKSIDEIKEIDGFSIMVEFVDSFPCKRFYKDKNFYEVWVDIEEKKEILKEVNNYDFLDYYEFLPDGYYFEYPLSFFEWFEKFLKKFKKGKILIIDYGIFKENLIFYPEGTIRGFKKHKVVKNIYDYEIGEIDITFTPDFSLLRKFFINRNLKIEKLTSLSNFLISEGIDKIFEREISISRDIYFKIKKLGEIKTLILPEIMGEKYFVLILKNEF